MDGKYILAIVILALFFILILVSFAFLEYARIKSEKLQAWIDERYADKDLNKFDYDTATADDEIPVQQAQEVAEEVNSISEDSEEDALPSIDEAYGKIDVEGIEEITGNYEDNK